MEKNVGRAKTDARLGEDRVLQGVGVGQGTPGYVDIDRKWVRGTRS